jgi:uridine phosphorylase
MQQYPILEYDSTPKAIIDIDLDADPLPNMSQHCVVCFFRDVFEQFLEKGLISPLISVPTEMGDHPVYLYSTGGGTVALLHQGMGSPLAAYLLEEMIAMGARKFIACGGAGVLDPSLAVGDVLVPTAAIRDEGTSYHYLPPSREVTPTPAALAAIESVLNQHGVSYRLAKTWTTDAFFRETPNKVALRKSEGCLTVEMEAAAMFAVAQFRKVEFAQLLYSGDIVEAENWDHRGWHLNWTVREQLVNFAAQACLTL